MGRVYLPIEVSCNHQKRITVGVSDVPFHTDDIDEEGLDVILGIDFIQETNIEIKA